MSRLADIESRIAGISELQDIVGAMRSLAGMRVQEALRCLPGVRQYAATIRAGTCSALLMVSAEIDAPKKRNGGALILFAAEHGFAGGFNERLAAAATAALGPEDALLVLGSRGAAFLSERRRRVDWWAPMATRLAGTSDMVNRLTSELYARIARGEVSRVDVLFASHQPGGGSTLAPRPLLPLDWTRPVGGRQRQAPLHNVPPAALLERLTAEYLFALLMEAAVESIASENAARLAAMESAYNNLTSRLEQLQQDARQARQGEITAELLDVITGTEAQIGEAKPATRWS